MCYSTRQIRKKEELENRLEVTAALLDPQYHLELTYYHANGFDNPVMWIVPQHDPNILLPAKWGIMPSNIGIEGHKEYFKNRNVAYSLNSQSEKIFGYYSYNFAPMQHRCIIPVDGFFEPHNTHVKVKGKDFRVPFYFTHRDGEPLYLAGLYEINGNGATFSIWTRKADREKDSMFFNIHNKDKEDDRRRPVVFDQYEIWQWLKNGLDRQGVQNMIHNDLRQQQLTAHPISKDLYSRKVNSNREDIIDRVDYDEISIKWN
ncbi:hypothetical protein FGF1_03220 [Flavobacteriaceae bacterium GF1]